MHIRNKTSVFAFRSTAAATATLLLVLSSTGFAQQDISETSITPPPAVVQVGPVVDAGVEQFVPRSHINVIGTLEIRREAVVTGPEVKLRQICRWSQDQSASFIPIADLVIDRLPSKRPKKITLDDLRTTLNDAGVNQGLVHFTGSTNCLVSCADAATDTPADDQAGLNQWIDQSIKKNATAAVISATSATSASAVGSEGSSLASAKPTVIDGSEVSGSEQFRTLRDKLLTDLSERLNIPVDRLQMSVEPKSTNLLNLSEPTFHFDLEPRRVRDLGRVSWDVSIRTGQSTQKVTVNGEARAWESQIVLTKPMGSRQIIRAADIDERRVLMDHVDDDTVLTREQALGQQAARDLKTGTVMTARLVETVPLARPGQYVSVAASQGGIEVQTVAKALESGSFGQSIRVKNEVSGETFNITLTGPQAGRVGAPPAAADAVSTDSK